MRKKKNSIDPVVKREMGAKLANFRRKLGAHRRDGAAQEEG